MINKYHCYLSSIDTRLDKRDKAILQYIKNNDGPNENQIVNALHEQKLSSKRTTLKKIKELKEKGEIIDSLKEGESGFHHYSINENNEFNKIYNSLLEIDSLIDKSSIFIKKIHHSRSNKDQGNLKLLSFDIDTLSWAIAVDTTLHMLLDRVSAKIHSKNDSQILYDKIISLFNKLDSQVKPYTIKTLTNISESIFKELKSPSLVENSDIVLSFTKDLRQFINNFKNRFSSNDSSVGQKTKKPH